MPGFLRTLTLAALLAFAPAVEARIGETERELVERFGAVEARMLERILAQGRVYVLGERLVLKQEEWRVTVVMLDGRCAKITYVKRGPWTEQHHRDLLAVNADRRTWTEVESGAPKWQRAWLRNDGLVAKWRYAGGFAIESHALVEARERIQLHAAHATAAVAAQ